MSQLRFPRSLQDVHHLAHILKQYRAQHHFHVLVAFCILYIFLQAFAIPGAIFLSILAGPLFGTVGGLCIVTCVATTGSCICYTLSWLLGRSFISHLMPSMLDNFRRRIMAHRSNLFYYLLFLRISPLLPNWFISVASPILDIPFRHFLFATLFGLLPANYLHISTGQALEQLEAGALEGKSTVDMRAVAFLFCAAFLALLPTLCKRRFEKFEEHMDPVQSTNSILVNSNEDTRKIK